MTVLLCTYTVQQVQEIPIFHDIISPYISLLLKALNIITYFRSTGKNAKIVPTEVTFDISNCAQGTLNFKKPLDWVLSIDAVGLHTNTGY